jgi:hypothetical protein
MKEDEGQATGRKRGQNVANYLKRLRALSLITRLSNAVATCTTKSLWT